ncbi:MAG: vancomycin high temperature exclusion protein [Dehalococcoidia bacterium]
MTRLRLGDTNSRRSTARSASREPGALASSSVRPGAHAPRFGVLPRGIVRLFRLLVIGIAVAFVGVAALRLYTVHRYEKAILAPEQVDRGRIAIVFGAGILPDGQPTAVLYDRVATAAELYRLGKVEQIILSGDGQDIYHNEPDVMRKTAVGFGVPETALTLDNDGVRTLESCRRARDDFGVEQAVLITQRFHLPRALMLCESLGMDAVGVASDRRDYSWRWRLSWHARETAATTVAWWEVNVGGVE